MKTHCIAIFDIGKTTKQFFLFDADLHIMHQEEEHFSEITDDDGFACEDIRALENWIIERLETFVADDNYNILGVNFSTYGATLAYIDNNGERLTPVYNYLKPMPEGLAEPLYDKYSGKQEFMRKTASPALGFLNSGLQILWLKNKKPHIYSKVHTILHFPQYLSFILTGITTSEYTSIGCHTALWDFDNMIYHRWVQDESIPLPHPVSNFSAFDTKAEKFDFKTGIGIHDSSAALVPYQINNQEKFVLVSTGTWAINMNPFNHTSLTTQELEKDCLCYLSINQKQVKSSRFFMGYLHSVNTEYLAEYFNVDKEQYKNVAADYQQIKKCLDSPRTFFVDEISIDYIDRQVDLSAFHSFDEVYLKLMTDLTKICSESIDLVLSGDTDNNNIYITGGFSNNPVFVKALTYIYPYKKIYTSTINNTSALGAALAIYPVFDKDFPDFKPEFKRWDFPH